MGILKRESIHNMKCKARATPDGMKYLRNEGVYRGFTPFAMDMTNSNGMERRSLQNAHEIAEAPESLTRIDAEPMLTIATVNRAYL
ncbi:MAG: hypothetical protein QXJ95_09635, partial [Ignisphaera sp.]